jgi:hypothetical protein
MALVDGLGGEEVNQTTNVQTAYIIAQTISGNNLYANGSVVAPRINDSNGALFSVSVGSPSTYGAMIQCGSVVTGASSGATIVFGTMFSTNQYKVAFGNVGGSEVAFVSGTTNISGCAIVGAASQTYNYIAIGL